MCLYVREKDFSVHLFRFQSKKFTVKHIYTFSCFMTDSTVKQSQPANCNKERQNIVPSTCILLSFVASQAIIKKKLINKKKIQRKLN